MKRGFKIKREGIYLDKVGKWKWEKSCSKQSATKKPKLWCWGEDKKLFGLFKVVRRGYYKWSLQELSYHCSHYWYQDTNYLDLDTRASQIQLCLPEINWNYESNWFIISLVIQFTSYFSSLQHICVFFLVSIIQVWSKAIFLLDFKIFSLYLLSTKLNSW